jgi:hypothetical protein
MASSPPWSAPLVFCCYVPPHQRMERSKGAGRGVERWYEDKRRLAMLAICHCGACHSWRPTRSARKRRVMVGVVIVLFAPHTDRGQREGKQMIRTHTKARLTLPRGEGHRREWLPRRGLIRKCSVPACYVRGACARRVGKSGGALRKLKQEAGGSPVSFRAACGVRVLGHNNTTKSTRVVHLGLVFKSSYGFLCHLASWGGDEKRSNCQSIPRTPPSKAPAKAHID